MQKLIEMQLIFKSKRTMNLNSFQLISTLFQPYFYLFQSIIKDEL